MKILKLVSVIVLISFFALWFASFAIKYNKSITVDKIDYNELSVDELFELGITKDGYKKEDFSSELAYYSYVNEYYEDYFDSKNYEGLSKKEVYEIIAEEIIADSKASPYMEVERYELEEYAREHPISVFYVGPTAEKMVKKGGFFNTDDEYGKMAFRKLIIERNEYIIPFLYERGYLEDVYLWVVSNSLRESTENVKAFECYIGTYEDYSSGRFERDEFVKDCKVIKLQLDMNIWEWDMEISEP